MALGAVLLLAALALFAANRLEERKATEAVERLMPQLVQRIEENRQTDTMPEAASATAPAADRAADPGPEAAESVPETTAPAVTAVDAVTIAPILPEAVPSKMTVAVIDGYGYIGYLSLPTLGLELPVMEAWDYDRLKLAPCRYAGTTMGDDLVIAAHDYARHFGRLEELAPGDAVTFTDMNGRVVQYTVTAVDVLAPTQISDMTAGAYDLTLFTCTYDGRNRFTVRCDRAV